MTEEHAAELLGRRAAALKRAGNSVSSSMPGRAWCPSVLHVALGSVWPSWTASPAQKSSPWAGQPSAVVLSHSVALRGAPWLGLDCARLTRPCSPPSPLPLPLPPPQAQARTPQRVAADAVVPQHSYIRAHLHPKRFPACYAVEWRVRSGGGGVGAPLSRHSASSGTCRPRGSCHLVPPRAAHAPSHRNAWWPTTPTSASSPSRQACPQPPQ